MKIDWFLLLEELKRCKLNKVEIERIHAPPPEPPKIDHRQNKQEIKDPPRVIILDI